MTKPAVAGGRTGSVQKPLGGARLDHVLIFVHDFDRMLRFYRDTLGFKLRFGNDRFAELSLGRGAGIALHAGAEMGATADPNMLIEFRVPDIGRAVRTLQARGANPSPIRNEPFGRISELLDPEGHRIGLEQPKR